MMKNKAEWKVVMHCGSCEGSVRRVFKAFWKEKERTENVDDVIELDRNKNQVKCFVENGEEEAQQLTLALQEVGLDASLVQVQTVQTDQQKQEQASTNSSSCCKSRDLAPKALSTECANTTKSTSKEATSCTGNNGVDHALSQSTGCCSSSQSKPTTKDAEGEERKKSSKTDCSSSACPSKCRRCKTCVDCTCGENCNCTETICRCQASSLLNALGCDTPSPLQGRKRKHKQKRQHYYPSTDPLEFPQQQEISATPNDDAMTARPKCNSKQSNGSPSAAMSSSSSSSSSTASYDILKVSIGGMTCSMCIQAINRSLEALDGVQDVRINLATEVGQIHFDPSILTAQLICKEITDIGYQILSKSIIHPHQGQNNADDLQDLKESQRYQARKKKTAFWWSALGSFPILVITMILPHALPSSSPLRRWLSAQLAPHFGVTRESFILAIFATFVQFGSGWMFYRNAYHNVRVCQLGMDVLVALGTTASYVYGWVQALHGEMAHTFETSSLLICFVLLGKWMNSLAVRRTSEALEQLMQLQSKTAIRVTLKSPNKTQDALSNVNESIGSGENDDHVEILTQEEVPIEDIYPGDIVKILRGASIPADGVVFRGTMTIDESIMTGESVPVLKTPGSLVLGGTVCIETDSEAQADGGAATTLVQVQGVGSQTALSQIVQLVQDAQTKQVPIQTLADSISSIFVPSVCLVSILTFIVWYVLCKTNVVPTSWYQADGGEVTFSIMFAIACLVISCPCALGLATPTAIMVGTGVGAKHGVLMKGGETLEMAARVDSVVFDKTGTLTVGKPCITDYNVIDDCDEYAPGNFVLNSKEKKTKKIDNNTYVLWLLASLEQNSEHPLALAVVAYARQEIATYLKDRPLGQPTTFKALTGRGASGSIDGHEVAIGNRAFCSIKGIVISRAVETSMSNLEREGKTAIVAAVDGKVAVIMGIADELKPDAAASLRYLTETMGVDVWMVTGDNTRTGRAISRKLGLPYDRVIAEALPLAKVQKVKRLQQEEGRTVAMIGDGINDSPALAEADVGMSLGTGAAIACEAADMVLVRGNVGDVCTALDLSRVMFRRIQWNLFCSLIYNCLGIPVAAGVLYPLLRTRLPPTLAAVAMALSSLSVVASSLALRCYQPPDVGQAPAVEGIAPIASISSRPRSRRRPRLFSHSSRETLLTSNRKTNRNISDDELDQRLLDHDYGQEGVIESSLSRMEEGREG